MAESKSNRVRFNRLTWVAARPQVLPVLQDILVCEAWGLLLTFYGTEADLIAAGVVTADAFLDMEKKGQRAQRDSFGDQYTVKRLRGKWELELRLRADGSQAPPSDERPTKCPWWIKHGGEAEAATAAILARFARPTG
jgi:hypothetical protein